MALEGFDTTQPAVTGNQVAYRYAAPANLSLAYLNDESGLHQRITLADPPDRTGRAGEAVLALRLNGTLIPRLANDGESIVYVAADKAEYLQQSQLAAVDARGRALPARFRLAGCSEAAPANHCNVEIVIAAATAELPVVVSTRLVSLMVAPATPAAPTATPTATPSGPGPSPAPDWASLGGQAGARMGRAATSAGDVNGDGYGDVIVGAETYDHGQVDEGRVYLFYGSPAGLSPTPNWSAESNAAGAKFGYQREHRRRHQRRRVR